jgi:membrane protease YdiL (CAAX protease family)
MQHQYNRHASMKDALVTPVQSGSELKTFWAMHFRFDWKLGVVLLVLVCVPRFLLVLDANVRGNYNLIGLTMVLSALAPFILLNKAGRRSIGLVKTKRYSWLLIAVLSGVIASLILYWLGYVLFGTSNENWYTYIAKSYKIPQGINPQDKKVMFTIMALVGMTFSPIGEELFFRGIVHSSFARSFGDKRASFYDGLTFAMVHIAHFGLVYINNRFAIYLIPMLIWASSMFLLSLLFYFCKKKCGSLLGAIVCHSGFNLGMIYSIFYLL